jgi:hypothetical protein
MSPYTNGTGASHEAGAEDTSGGVLSDFDKYVTSDPNRCAGFLSGTRPAISSSCVTFEKSRRGLGKH